jgi:hypothetical protein
MAVRAEGTPGEGIHDRGHILQLSGEGVAPEPVGPHQLAPVVHAAAAQVERDRREAGSGQPLGQRREHSPVLEPLPAVNHDDGRTGRFAAPGADIDQELAQGAGELVG